MGNRQKAAHSGKKLGRYRIERELGRGGMGVVYVATDEHLSRQVALKTTSMASIGSSEQARTQRQQRFLREVKALAQVNHENVVHVFDAGEADDPELGWLLFYTMQFVDGITLAQLVHRLGALDAGAASAVCMQVAAGLGAAHQTGIVHRDVKPANIFIDKAGRALIGDFGICKLEGSTQITRRDQLVGTPNYLAPEQILGDDITPATDVFALGALFFVIVTNAPLRERVDPASLLAEAQTNDPKKKMLALKHIPDGLRKVVGRALEREPQKRYRDCAHFADALSDFATRIPVADALTSDSLPLPASRSAPAPLDTHTSPFAPMPGVPASVFAQDSSSEGVLAQDTPAPAPFEFAGSGAAGVEEAALALLKDAGIGDEKSDEKKRKKPKAKKETVPDPGVRPPPQAPALPVARVESTVMFNLRQQESDDAQPAPHDDDDDEDDAPLLEPKAPAGKDLPVARAESTVMFNLRQMEEKHQPKDAAGGASANPFAEASDPRLLVAPAVVNPALAEPTQLFASDDEADDDDDDASTTTSSPLPQPVVKRVDAVAVARRAGPKKLPPNAILIAAGVGGILLGVILLLVLSALLSDDDGGSRRSSGASAPVALPVDEAPSLPEGNEACRGRARSDRDRTTAAALIREAEGVLLMTPPEARKKIDAALRLDPRSAAGHALRARMLANEKDVAGALDAYRCVVFSDPTSPEADTARDALAKFARLNE